MYPQLGAEDSETGFLALTFEDPWSRSRRFTMGAAVHETGLLSRRSCCDGESGVVQPKTAPGAPPARGRSEWHFHDHFREKSVDRQAWHARMPNLERPLQTGCGRHSSPRVERSPRTLRRQP